MRETDLPADLGQMISDTFDEMHAEAQIEPIVLTFAPEVTLSIEKYMQKHSPEPATMIALAIEAQEHQSEIFSEAGERLMKDPDSFTWPVEDPLLCVALAFMLKHASRCAEKVHEKYDLDNDEVGRFVGNG